MAWTIPCSSSLDSSVSSERLRTPGRFKQKEDLIAEMLDCLKKLNGVDQVILGCWMVYPKGEYTDMAIEELGWDNNKRTRNVVNVRCNRAIAMLGNMMEEYRIYISVHPAKGRAIQVIQVRKQKVPSITTSSAGVSVPQRKPLQVGLTTQAWRRLWLVNWDIKNKS